MALKSYLTPYERLNLQFIQYAEEHTVLTMQIENKELAGEDVEMEMYERQHVLADNIDFVLEQVVKLNLISNEEQ